MQHSRAAIPTARLQWDDQGYPHSAEYGDIYFSGADPEAESRHVFLHGNRLDERFAACGPGRFVIAECGFGTGLNFLNTCRLWHETAPAGADLHYLACENRPLERDDLKRIHRLWPALESWTIALQQHYPEPVAGIHRLCLTSGERRITLDLLYGDAADMLGALPHVPGFRVDAWFLDGFSPAVNPALWSESLLRAVAAISRERTTAATYSAAGSVRRTLQAAGFSVERTGGSGRKRHMLRAVFSGTPGNITRPLNPVYAQPSPPRTPPGKAAIVGGGLAGCASAAALARRGWRVTLIERGDAVATAASGNPQGILYCKTARRLDPASRFMLHAYLFATRHYTLLAREHDFRWHPCGLLQLAGDREEIRRQQTILERVLYPATVTRGQSPAQCSARAGIGLHDGGLFFPAAGWLDPRRLCRTWSRHPSITVRPGSEALHLRHQHGSWQLSGAGAPLAEADVVIVAAGTDAVTFEQTRHYPLIPNRGQIDRYSPAAGSDRLSTIVCGDGYMIPACDGLHTIGGTTTPGIRDVVPADEDRRRNLALLEKTTPELARAFAENTPSESRAGVRCSTPDYLPVAGPVEDLASCRNLYRELAQNARNRPQSPPAFHPGLYINAGHGAHGIATAPLCAEYLAALIDGEPVPFTRDILEALHPIRFLIRDLKKQRL